MKTVGSFNAKTHLSVLLDRVQRGESFLITKRGKPMATLSPVGTGKKQGPKDLIEDFRKQFHKSLKRISPREIAEWKALGRR